MDSTIRTVVGDYNVVQQVRDLLTKCERLANEVARKEVLLNSIEYKMFEVSDRVVKAHEFSQWIDEILEEKIIKETNGADTKNHTNLIFDRKYNREKECHKIYDVLSKYTNNIKPTDSKYAEKIDKWLAEQQCKKIKLEIEQQEQRTLICNIEETISKFTNVCYVLRKHMKERKQQSTHSLFHENCSVDCAEESLAIRKYNELKMVKENEEYKKMMASVENGISELDSKIVTFTDCLNSCDVKIQNNARAQVKDDVGNSSVKITLDEIESKIRSFDAEHAQFQIKDFSSWMEKIKSKMIDLESNAENEKKVRSSKEKQHAMEREILNYLFNQKQKEISILKEKVSSKVLTLSDIKPVHLARVEG